MYPATYPLDGRAADGLMVRAVDGSMGAANGSMRALDGSMLMEAADGLMKRAIDGSMRVMKSAADGPP